jgi:hypothetical protein
MAELLLRVVSKTAPGDIRRDTKLTKRGDVIVAKPDGWRWVGRELTSPQWRILKVPALSLSEASMLLAAEPYDDPVHPSLTRQRRMYRLDIDNVALPSALATYLADETREEPAFILTLDIDRIRRMIVRKPKIADPGALS